MYVTVKEAVKHATCNHADALFDETCTIFLSAIVDHRLLRGELVAIIELAVGRRYGGRVELGEVSPGLIGGRVFERLFVNALGVRLLRRIGYAAAVLGVAERHPLAAFHSETHVHAAQYLRLQIRAGARRRIRKRRHARDAARVLIVARPILQSFLIVAIRSVRLIRLLRFVFWLLFFRPAFIREAQRELL